MKHFKLEEFKCRCGCTIPEEAKANLTALIDQVLDPARAKLNRPVMVNSGYRCPKHNQAVGGAPNSQHCKGEAADICCTDNMELARLIVANGNYDQLILYVQPWSLKPRFIHVSWKRTGTNRHQILKKEDGQPHYTPLSIAA
jgi:hypothetical protein